MNTAVARLVCSSNVEARSHVPFRTFTCTEEYPLVTFLTLRTTLDMVSDVDATTGESERGKPAGHTGETDQTGRAIVTVRAGLPSSHSPLAVSWLRNNGPSCCSQTNSRVNPAPLVSSGRWISRASHERGMRQKLGYKNRPGRALEGGWKDKVERMRTRVERGDAVAGTGGRSLGNDEAAVKLWICDLRGESCQEKSRREFGIFCSSISDRQANFFFLSPFLATDRACWSTVAALSSIYDYLGR